MTAADRFARAALSRVAEPGDPAVAAAVTGLGAEQVWACLREGVPLAQVPQTVLPGLALRAVDHDPADDLRAAAACGARLVCPGDAEWPEVRLSWLAQDLPDAAPPLALWVRGREPLDEVVERSVAVVGARAATTYGVHVAGELAAGLSQRRATVISGGAYGIDAAAHRGALVAGPAPTVAVLACGVDVAYPRGNDRLLRQVAEHGLLVSELPPGSHPTRRRFLVRNRLIAALSLGTVVVEAAVRSGSLATLERARRLGRHLMAVPGPVTSGMSAGCHAEVRKGAELVTSAAEVLDLVGRIGEDAVVPARGPVDVRDGLSELVRQVLDALPVRRSCGLSVIARASGVSPLTVQQVLPPLVAHGLVERTEDGWRLTPLGAGRPAPGSAP